MRQKNRKRRLVVGVSTAATLGLAASISHALNLEGHLDNPSWMTETYLAGSIAGTGVTVLNSTISTMGKTNQIGEVSNMNEDGLPSGDAVVLTTGNYDYIDGQANPNTVDEPSTVQETNNNMNTKHGGLGHTNLSNWIFHYSTVPKHLTEDAAAFSFDFTTTKDNIKVTACLASEEYNDWNEEYADVFAIYVNGVNIARKDAINGAVQSNLSVVAFTNAISAFTINASSTYFNANTNATEDTQFDGYSDWMTFSYELPTAGSPGTSTNNIEFVIADVGGDDWLDSAAFIKLDSLIAFD